jgi:hypothetical protein
LARQPSAFNRDTSRSLRGVPSGLDVSNTNQLTPVADDLSNDLGELSDCNILTGRNVEEVDAGIALHREHARVG